MPELPEVETTRRGLVPHLTGRRIVRAIVRNRALRWPIPAGFAQSIEGAVVRSVGRRAKYLLLDCGRGWLIVHLGMSGRIRLVPAATPPEKHDHVDLVLDSGMAVRYTDPRRFGSMHWTADWRSHELIAGLGPEPLDEAFDAE